MKELDELTNESFNDLFQTFLATTELYNHYDFALNLAKEATGHASLFDLIDLMDSWEFVDYDSFEDSYLKYEAATDVYNDTKFDFISQLDDGLSTVMLQNVDHFDEFYYDFIHVTGYVGEKEDFEYSLRRSVDFFNFLVDVTTEE